MSDIVCKVNGEIVDDADVDAMADMLIQVREQMAALRATEHQLAVALALKAAGPERTRRLRGERRRVKVELPDDAWDQKGLAELWAKAPLTLAEKYVRIGSFKVKLVEYKKLLCESGGPDFMAFKEFLVSCNLGPQGLPRVTVEE